MTGPRFRTKRGTNFLRQRENSPSLGLLRFAAQAIGGYEGGHNSQFLNRNIEAVTVASIYDPFSSTPHTPFVLSSARAFEQTVRALNGLSERLHHTTFFYLLLDAHKFITMSKFIYPFFLLLLAFAAKSYRLLNEQSQTTLRCRPSITFLMVLLFSSLSMVTFRAAVVVFFIAASCGVVFLFRLDFELSSIKSLLALFITLSSTPLGILNFPLGYAVLFTLYVLLSLMPSKAGVGKFSALCRLLALAFFSPPVILLVGRQIHDYIFHGDVLQHFDFASVLQFLQLPSFNSFSLQDCLWLGLYFPVYTIVQSHLLLQLSCTVQYFFYFIPTIKIY